MKNKAVGPFSRQYRSSRELFEDTWEYGSRSEKERLLKARNLHPSWAVTKSPQEMVNRGGGLQVRDLGKVFDEFVKRNPNQRVTWRVRK